ncbi:MAG: hypothetical protein RL557_568 [archaeon]|jgi:hypothetical protein
MFSKDKKLFNKKTSGKPESLKKREITYSSLNWFKDKTHFSGASPPEIFVGRYNYPHVNAGILSPETFENTEEMSLPELWHEKKFSIHDVLMRRSQLVYGRFKANIQQTQNRFIDTMQQLSMASQSVSTEFFLKQPPKNVFQTNRVSSVIANPAPLQFAKLQENPKVKPKVDYLVNDTNAKSVESLKELYSHHIPISNLSKLLSAGLLGLKSQRKLVPTRWSITAVDDTLSKNLLKKIKYYNETDQILLFHAEYNGNHYEILLLPAHFSFEVIEIESLNGKCWQDYELFHGRKTYAENVVGAYYANRLALCEYLEKIKKQATAIFFREIKPTYYAPLGVGILRECSREAFTHPPETCASLEEAFEKIQQRIQLPISLFTEKSTLLKNYGKQKKIHQWF